MARVISKKTTTTVTEEVELIPAAAGAEREHRVMRVHALGEYRGARGQIVTKPQISLNGKWLAEAGFEYGDQVDVEVHENELVIRKMVIA